jgi:hypothetical protein
MSIGEYGTLIAVLLAMGFALRQIRTDPRITKAFTRKTLVAVGGYLLFCALGFGIFVALIQTAGGAHAGAFVFGFFIIWIALAVVWLIRLAPRLREPPAWLMRPWSTLDRMIIAALALCVLGVILQV